MFLPAGSQDEIGQTVDNRSKAYEIFRQVMILRNYKQISTPVVEFADTFTNEYAGMNLQNMLKWFNREGEIEVLRPDWTTAIARALVKQHPSELKWSYQGSVFRRDKDGIESRQAGIEIVHTPVFLGEGESLLTAVQYLKELNIADYLIELGHTGIFDELTAPLQLSDQELDQLREAMHDKRRDVVFTIVNGKASKEQADEITAMVDAFGSFDVIEEYEVKWKDNPRLLEIIKHLKKLATLLTERGVKDVSVDLGRVKNLPYYCGTMFRGYLKETGATCFSGGRYDKLYEQFDESISAVGLAFDVDVLADHLHIEESYERICIIAEEASHAYAEELRHTFTNAIVDIQYTDKDKEKFDRVFKVIKENDEYKVVEQ
ncbi:ATP phosphoribosyltransferase regulatory subunit [Aquibacillus salsiterrae]|uniref:ATP phosphoribosyltransferase regulatory subunit n=1 Tax=Aquibacillus salsiterrae TaxID=2950439 RepID=A0A9X4AE24_9BACI|nr:ATP phosphoribosyltransferase regulatory subunit [Aquibacillus salsiterrae]MDC3416272.1 ATP phosphoribosyltransferase regulatory subunit [Aquibacillus salsiterrae]